MIAINLGVYEKSLNCITTFFKNIKNNINYLGLLGIGIVTSISLFSKWIMWLLNNYYLITMSLFLGLIMGSNNIENYGHKYKYMSFFSFSLILSISLLSGMSNIIMIDPVCQFFYMILIGIVEAMTMIIPGISGTAILMMLGVYNLVISTYSNIFDLSLLQHNLSILLPLFTGIIIGIYLVSNIMNCCFKKYRIQTYQAIKGCVYGTVFSMLLSLFKKASSINEIVTMFLIIIITVIIIKKLKCHIDTRKNL